MSEVEQTAEELEAQEDAEYNAAFEEFSTGEPLAGETKPEENVSEGEGVTPQPEEDPSSTAAEAATDEGSEPETTTVTAEDPDAWIQALPEEFRAKASTLQNTARSHAGRAAAAQARLDELTAREHARARVAQTAPATPAKAEEDPELPQQLQEFVEKYPQLSEAMELFTEQKAGNIDAKLEQALAPVREQLEYERIKNVKADFEQRASELLDTPNSDVTYMEVIHSTEYKDYIASQPEFLRDMARNTQDPEEALFILNGFMNHARGLIEEHEAEATPSAPQQKRTNLEGHVTPASRTAIVDGGSAGNTYMDDFEHFAQGGK
jgi:hypothetical protein